MKHYSFSAEDEFRIVSQPIAAYDTYVRRFREGDGIVIPYTEFMLPKERNFWSSVRVYVGPSPHPKASKASVYALIRKHWDTASAIEITQTPYRDW